MDLSSLLHVAISPVISTLQPNDPLELRVTVRNAATHGITLLKWNSPLDERAGKLGIFSARDIVDGTLLEGDVIMANRKLPPTREDLVCIEPGSEIEGQIKLLPLSFQKGRKYQVQGKWRWMSAWRGGLDNSLELVEKPEVTNSAECKTNVVEVEII
ncbi:MAG: hypothetical protein Q9227_008618 [Pyrenula ochraceoflavens]